MDVPAPAAHTEPRSGDAVKAVPVIGTGTVRIRPEHLYGTRKPPLLLVGDLAYHADLMPRGQLPGVGHRRQLAESTRNILTLAGKHPGLVVLPAHDPTAARRLLAS